MSMQSFRKLRFLARALPIALAGVIALPAAQAGGDPVFLPRVVNSSTIPANGDLNPYGVAFVPEGFRGSGRIRGGDVLVSNFNNSANIQGTGTTIIQLHPPGPLAPPGTARTFFSSALPGLSTALGVLRGGFVLVGNVPTTDGTFATIGQGALQVLDRNGTVVHTWADPQLLDGPWDLAIDDHDSEAHIFVSNVLNGTVSRLDVSVSADKVILRKALIIGHGYAHAPNAAAVVLGPTGLAFDATNDTLYVASTADNAIFAIYDAAHRSQPQPKGSPVFADPHLRGPLALRFAPNGNLLTANGDAVNADPEHPSEIVEFTRAGRFLREYDVDASQGGAFGFDVSTSAEDEVNFAVVDDVTNSLEVRRVPFRW